VRKPRQSWRNHLALTIAAGVAPSFAVAQGTFHLTFGTTGSPRGRDADAATFVVETDSGDLVVAGQGASYFSDDGIGIRTNPMVARIDSRGVLQWQRVYTDMENQRILALASRGEEQYMVLAQPEPNIVLNAVALRRVDAAGNPSEVLGTIEGISVLGTMPAVDEKLTGFFIAGKRGATPLAAHAADVELLQIDLQGRVTQMSFESGVFHIQHLQQVGGREFLYYKHNEHEIVRLSRAGETKVLATTLDGSCKALVASRDRIICSQTRWMKDDVIVAYSLAGQELWRRDLQRHQSVWQMVLLESGDLIYSYATSEDPIVNRVSPSGDLIWSQTLHSAGQFTFLGGIELLRDGRLAFLGSTGPRNGFVSEDTNAMLVVTGTSEGDLSGSEIVSSVVDCAAVASC
jgi:hypothetical protein